MMYAKALARLSVVVAFLLSGAATAQGLSAVSTATCPALYAELDSLLDASGAFSLRLVQRSREYRSIIESIEALEPVPVPYEGENLRDRPLEEATGLRSTTRTVRRTEAAPNYTTGIGAMALGGLLVYSGVMSMDADSSSSSSSSEDGDVGTANLVLGGLLIAGGVAALANTRTVTEQVPDQEAIRYNRRVRERVAAANRRIREENEALSAKREERSEAADANRRVNAERLRLEAERDAYEASSRDLYEATVERLAEAGTRRCVSELEATGALLTIEGRLATVYLVTRPLNRDGELLPDASSIDGLSFSVRELRLRDPLGVLASLDGERPVPLLRVSALPFAVPGPDATYVTRVPLRLENDPVDDDELSVDGRLSARQDGQLFEASFSLGATIIER